MVWCRAARLAMLQGAKFEIGPYTTAVNSLRRLLVDLGLEAKLHDVTPSLQQYLNQKAKERSTAVQDAEVLPVTPPDASPVVDFASFCADVLPAWQSDTPIVADERAPSAKRAAMIALHKAVLIRTGTVVIVADVSEHRTIQGYLDAMIGSSPMLRGLGARIAVTTPERAPLLKAPAAIIAMAGAGVHVAGDEDRLPLSDVAKAVLEVALMGEPAVDQFEDMMGLERGAFKQPRDALNERAAQNYFRQYPNAMHGVVSDAELQPVTPATSVPVVPRSGRDLIGDGGHWVEQVETGNDGREKFAIYDPAGTLLGMRWGRDKAEQAIDELVSTGAMSA